MPPPVERSTRRTTGILTSVLAAWSRIQDFERNSVELGIMELNQVKEMKKFRITCLRRSGGAVMRICMSAIIIEDRDFKPLIVEQSSILHLYQSFV